MDFLHTDNLITNIILDGNTKKLEIKINNTNYKYIGTLPNKSEIRGFKKYKLDDELIEYINSSQILNVHFDELKSKMYILIDNLEFSDGKKYTSRIDIKMKRIFDCDIDENMDINNIEIFREKLKTSIDYIKILENRISKLEEEIESSKSITYDYPYDYSDFNC